VGEKTGTKTSSERLVSFSSRSSAARHGSADWQILARFGQAMGFSGFPSSRLGAGLGRVHRADRRPALRHGGDDVRAAPARATPALALPKRRHPGTERSISIEIPRPQWPRPLPRTAAPPPARDHRHEFPLVLTTDGCMPTGTPLTRTASRPKLVRLEPSPFVEVHPDDAAEVGLAAGSGPI